MADPAWGTTSLLEEESTHALCTFQPTDPLSKHHKVSLEQQLAAPLSQPHSVGRGTFPQHAREAPPADGYAYCVPYMHHITPIPLQPSETAADLDELALMASDDWQQLQHKIQEQFEQQQQELLAQRQKQQQRELFLQEKRIQADVRQQELPQRRLQMRVEKHPSSGAEEYERMTWHKEAQAQSPQSSQAHVEKAGCCRQLPKVSSINGIFAAHQVSQPIQSHLKARNPKVFLVREDTLQEHELFSIGAPANTTFTSPMHKWFQRLPQQLQPYSFGSKAENSHQEMKSSQSTSNFCTNDFIIDELVEFYSTNLPPIAAPSASRIAAAQDKHVSTINFEQNIEHIIAQTRNEASTRKQVSCTNSRRQIPPTKASIVPGNSLTSESMRILSMRDLLNGDNTFTKLDSSRNRAKEGKQKQVHSNWKAPSKEKAVKHRRLLEQLYKRKHKSLSMSRVVGDVLLRQHTISQLESTNLSKSKFLSLKKPRSARSVEQTAGHAEKSPISLKAQPMERQKWTTAIKSMGPMNRQAVASSAERFKQLTRKKMIAPKLASSSGRQQAKGTGASAQAALATTHTEEMSGCSQLKANMCINNDRKCAGDASDPPTKSALRCHEQKFSKKLLCIAEGGLVEQVHISKKRRRLKLTAAHMESLASRDTKKPHEEANHILSSQFESRLQAETAVRSSSKRALTASNISSVENRTIVIFCKRDFMRYQAVKIWRKYQDQFEAQEEWREVRVAGKRTRYLHSRYDQLQRLQKRKYTRSCKLRQNALNESYHFETSSSQADSKMPISTEAVLLPFDNGPFAAKWPDQMATEEIDGCGPSTDVQAACSGYIKLVAADNSPMKGQNASKIQQKPTIKVEANGLN